jgi:DNA-directed RNA polymerase specialized sigma24 family protein
MSSLAVWAGRRARFPRQGHRFHTMVRTNVAQVGRLLRWLGVPDSRLDEVSTEIFLALDREMEVLSPGSGSAFLIERCLQQARRARRARNPLREQGHGSCAVPPSSRLLRARRLLHDSLEAMPQECREVFVLHELEKLELREVGELLAISSTVARQRLGGAYEAIARESSQEGMVLLPIDWPLFGTV